MFTFCFIYLFVFIFLFSSNLGFLLRSLLFRVLFVIQHGVIVRVVVVGCIIHLGVTATLAAAALVRGVEFLGDVGVGIGAEVLVDGFLVLVRGTAVGAAGVIVAG